MQAATDSGFSLLSDMRAFGNPQRLRTIATLARRLGERLARYCPYCDAPGFGGDRPIAGLPCAECGTPTRLALAIEPTCLICGGRTKVARKFIDG